MHDGTIHNMCGYRKAMAVIDEERKRIDGHVEVWKKQGLPADEIKRLMDPMMSIHLQFVEEAEAWRKEQDSLGMGVEESADGFAVSEPQPGTPAVLYYGYGATASRMDMFLPNELFPTREEAEVHMVEMTPTTGGCMGPTPPSRDKITATTNSVLTAIRRMDLLKQDEESLCPAMAESRRRALWLLEKSVEEILIQDACETF